MTKGPGESDERVEPLSTGAIIGGVSRLNQEWRELLDDFSRRVSAAGHATGSPINVNVVFQVPGEFLQPDFLGTRTGIFRRKDRWLVVQVALPEAPPENANEYLKSRLSEALDEAESWALRKYGVAGLPELRHIASKL